MRKHLFGVLTAGMALALVAGGQSAAEPAAPLFQPDPMLAFLPAEAKVDWAAVQRNRESRKQSRVAAKSAGQPLTYTEKETGQGANDVPSKAEHVAGFGTGRGKNPKLTLTGDLAGDPTIPVVAPFAETNDAIPLASDPGVPVRTSGKIGDGPYGSGGDGTGDHDFYKLSGGTEGRIVVLETDTPTGDLDTLLAAFDATGQLLNQHDNLAGSTDSRLRVPVAAGQDVYVMVASAGPGGIPADPMKPGTGKRVLTEGAYDLTIATGGGPADRDHFSVDLKAGDVLGASAAGKATRVVVHDPAGREVFGSSQDFSFLYAENSPMPAGGNAVADFVAPKDGRYTVGVENGDGRYDVTVEAYRPGSELNQRPEVLTIFLDFDGARVNTRIFGVDPSAGNKDLSPLRKFLPGWGLTDADENAVIDGVVATVRENIEHDLAAKGTNKRFAVRILNSRDHADPWGQRNVSRVVVGGSIAEAGIQTVGIAQSIDAGNFGKEETSLVLLDILSAPAAQTRTSLNGYITPASDKIAFIGRAIGNITAHEAGHMSGSWHQDQFNALDAIMDQGGNPKGMFGVGPDGIGGTADDIDVDFHEDVLNPNEGFTGIEDSLNRTAWAYTRGAN
ncbi:hypothetical protein [Lentzea albidocapillata]|uniref:Pre-peptidase C-terminal domain-containing protein n=1 Tax=Lentzea albidocapillata TaxID=40571 RepID=A0A1W2FBR9_9PSEU|nr:hypothetical protein [Lentzea albidocapillata]SMD19351.1 hypothetical protein SAMN05660733_05505 [Lentzea albidocapillata]